MAHAQSLVGISRPTGGEHEGLVHLGQAGHAVPDSAGRRRSVTEHPVGVAEEPFPCGFNTQPLGDRPAGEAFEVAVVCGDPGFKASLGSPGHEVV